MSIRWRILGAFLLVILLTVIIGLGFDYWSRGKELSDFSTKIRTEDLADVISRQYSADGGWQNLESILVRYGVLLDDERVRAAEVDRSTSKTNSPGGWLCRM